MGLRTPEQKAIAEAFIEHGFDREQSWKMAVCSSKVAYRTRKDAKRISQYYRNIYHDKQVPYKCKMCGQWHLTTKKDHSEESEVNNG